jgi:flagellar basal body-associated protein FliL
MTEIDGDAAKAVVGKSGGRFRFWRLIAMSGLLIAAMAGGGGYWYFFLGQRPGADSAQIPEPEAPLPFYLEVKPFVVSMVNSTGTPHFVQLGVNLTLSGGAAANVVSVVLPEVQDAMRQTALTFKVDDIVTPVGVDKMREAMIARVNRALLQRLGAERVKRLNGSQANNDLVQNIYFSTLIVE